jgi:hypothetical protein
MTNFKLLLIWLAILPLVVWGQEEEIPGIGTDRPVQSETPSVIPKGYIQAEEGLYYEQGTDFTCENRKSIDLLANNLLLKYGLIKNLELRLTVDYFHFEYQDRTTEIEQKSSIGGLNAPNVGLKYAFLKQDKGWKPNLTLSAHSQVDLWGREEFKLKRANVNFRLTAGKNVTENWYVLAGFGTNFIDGLGDATGQFYVCQTGYTFFSKLTLVAEYYGLRDYALNLNLNAVNGALVYLINQNHQLDLSGGMGLDDNFYGYYVSLGYSFRIHP